MARVPSVFAPGSLVGPSLFGTGLDPFMSLHRDVNRLFDDVLRGGGVATGNPTGVMLAPSVDVSETESEIRVKAELPGVSEKDIDVSLHDDVLAIRAEKRAERKEEREGVHVSERAFGTFQRALRLPFHADPQQIRARFENGVLSVTVPKTQPEQRQHRIQVQSGSTTNGQQGITGPNGNSNGSSTQGSAGMTSAGDGSATAPSTADVSAEKKPAGGVEPQAS